MKSFSLLFINCEGGIIQAANAFVYNLWYLQEVVEKIYLFLFRFAPVYGSNLTFLVSGILFPCHHCSDFYNRNAFVVPPAYNTFQTKTKNLLKAKVICVILPPTKCSSESKEDKYSLNLQITWFQFSLFHNIFDFKTDPNNNEKWFSGTEAQS